MNSQVCVARVQETRYGEWKRCVMLHAQTDNRVAVTIDEETPRVIEDVWDYHLVYYEGCFWVDDPEAE